MATRLVGSLVWVLAHTALAATSATGGPDADNGVRVLAPGVHPALRLTEANVRVRCRDGAVIDAGGSGSAVLIDAPGVSLEGCVVRGWGRDLTALDAGIFITPEARGARVIGNTLSGPGFGIWLDATPEATVQGNVVEGDTTLRSQDRGNGIHLHATFHARIVGNDVFHTRDGIYIETANHNLIKNNDLHDLRYGVHYMYSYDNRIIGNRTHHTRTGYALMQSKRLTVVGNRSDNDENYGILMNFITQSEIRDNRVSGVRQGTRGGEIVSGAEGKAVFIYNSVFNTIVGNRFADSDIGINLTAGSEDNRVYGNAFVANRQQVKYVATRPQEWSFEGRGNYWSDYLGWDRDQDGTGDLPYEPNDNVDRLLWTYPEARLLMHSPAVSTLRWVQRAFPVVKAPGVRDSHPLMHPPGLKQENTP